MQLQDNILNKIDGRQCLVLVVLLFFFMSVHTTETNAQGLQLPLSDAIITPTSGLFCKPGTPNKSRSKGLLFDMQVNGG